MPNIKDLIEKLCPDGVEYKSIREICDFVQGFAFKNNTFKQEGVGLVRTTNIQDKTVSKDNMVYIDFEDYKENLSKYIIKKDKILIGMSGTIKVGINNSNEEYLLNQRVGMFIPYEDIINNRFLFYILDNSVEELYNLVSGSSVKNLSSNVLNEYKIAVPPLEVQCEIVHILDYFTLLSAELSAELKARQQQYEYYKNELYSFKDKDVKYVKLKEIAEIYRGGNFQKKDFIENGKPCIHYGQIYTKYGKTANKTYTFVNDTVFEKSKQAGKNDIVMAVTSENIEDVCKCVVWLGNENIAVSGHTAIIHTKINARYLGYYFSTLHFFIDKAKLAHGTKVIEVTPSSLNDILIPVPSEEEQENIASEVENFEKLCNDISEGLPAEIEARQKQYEYYRDKLLTFKELKVNE